MQATHDALDALEVERLRMAAALEADTRRFEVEVEALEAKVRG